MRPTETAAATSANGGGGATGNSTLESSGREALSPAAAVTDSSPPSLDLSLGGGGTMRFMATMNRNQQFGISPLAGCFSSVMPTPVMNPFQQALCFNSRARHGILQPQYGILNPPRVTEAIDFLGVTGANAVQTESDSSSVVINHNREINLDLDLNLPPPPENA
ncbi:hypothetical protein ACH5RR_015144 [Cinchona calisaya]|uniref:Uncharacterized protein n=1 Tax=Cinchona calisaya TaxID=153742 RepID=A0ABD2ZVE9_9GENT